MVNKLDNLDSKQLSDILHLVMDEPSGDLTIDEVAHTEFMNECLNTPFTGGRFQERAISEIPEMLQRSFVLTGKHQLSELIYDENAPLLERKRAKSFFNDRSKHEKDSVKKDVYIALYYALIAAALVNCNKKITEHSTLDLHGYLKILQKKDWIPEAVREVFGHACDYLAEIQSMDTRS